MPKYAISIKELAHGQCLVTVVKDGKLDKGENPYVSLQMPTDFAKYVLRLQEVAGAEVEQEIMVDSRPRWMNNELQFTRFIAELRAAGAFTSTIIEDLETSMGLSTARVWELIERADRSWEEIKQKLH